MVEGGATYECPHQSVSYPPSCNRIGLVCTAGAPVTANCLDNPASGKWGHGSTAYTDFSTYQPFVYVIPGVAMINAEPA